MREFSRIKRLPPYVFNITNELKMAARRAGEDIIDMSMGNPDGPTPKHIVDKLVEAAQRPDTHGYSVSKGIPRLRLAITAWYRRRYGVELDPDSEAIVTIGSKEGLAHLMLATLDRGDTVLVPNPSYPIHIYGAIIAGADIRSVRMTPGVDFFAEAERAIRELIPKPKMLVIGFPSNPTAMCVELEFFERVIAQHVSERGHQVRLQPVLGALQTANGLIEAQRVDDPVACEGIDHEPLAVLGDDFLRGRIEVQDALVDIDDVLDDRQLPVQPRLRDDGTRIAELKDDRLLCHADSEGGQIEPDQDDDRNDAGSDCNGPVHQRPPFVVWLPAVEGEDGAAAPLFGFSSLSGR